MADHSSGFFASLKHLLATLVSTGKTRLELLATELEEEKIRLTRQLVFTVAALIFLGIGMVLLVALITAAFWESRIAIFAIFSLIFIGAGLALAFSAQRLGRRHDGLFASSINELKADLDALRQAQAAAQDRDTPRP
ncbi:MAG TPA: phage holin family protein [Azospira sp.]|nr:phage holin family protein [Azospira sp.]